jgi:hypothetical protein
MKLLTVGVRHVTMSATNEVIKRKDRVRSDTIDLRAVKERIKEICYIKHV